MPEGSPEVGELARELRRHVALLRSTGIHGLSSSGEPIIEPAPAPSIATVPQPQEQKTIEPKPSLPPIPEPVIAPSVPEVTPPPQPMSSVEPKADDGGARSSLEELRAHIGDCTRCALHSQGRQHVVFGVGNPNASIMFVGEAPGANEDREGIPFVGRAGELLTKIIENGMKTRREDVYIANVIKCRPPQNRDPTPEEVATCRPFILEQINMVNPRVIVTLGRVAAQALLQTSRSITHMRGTWQEIEGRPVMPTFHPAYLLRNPAGKRDVWSDIQEVLRFLSEKG